MLNRSASLAISTSVLKALPGKLDVKRPGKLDIKRPGKLDIPIYRELHDIYSLHA